MSHTLITFDDVMRFLELKTLVKHCPSCSENSWTLHYSRLEGKPDLIFCAHALPVTAPLESKKHANHQLLPFGRPLLPLVCDNCGYVKSYDYNKVYDWVVENPVSKNESNA